MVDVRTIPRSRTNPQYNLDTLPGSLAEWQMAHCRIAPLGGFRSSAPVAPEINGWWINRSFHNYADHALSDLFAEGLEELIAAARQRRTAIMCSEAVWWRCHRRIIADYLISRGWPVLHLMGKDRMQIASMTPAAVPRDGKLVYPAVGSA